MMGSETAERTDGFFANFTFRARIGRALRPGHFLATLAMAFGVTPALAECRQALSIGLDVSGSVDEAEYRLQRDGLAQALLNPDVRMAFLAIPDAPVRLHIFEWAGTGTQNLLIPWTDVTDETVLRTIASTLISTPRQPHELATAIGQAMLFGGRELATQSDCWRLTLDLSGDGQSNLGPRPRDVKGALLPSITINAVVIGSDAGDSEAAIDSEIARLISYFRAEVIRGPDAFVEAAIGFKDFENAMARKLLKELQTLAVGSLMPEDQ